MVLFTICILGTIVLSLPAVQTSLAKKATKAINDEYGTSINIDRVRVSLVAWETDIKGIYIEDYKKDTLFYIKRLTTSVLSMRNMANGKLQFGDVEIDSLLFNLKTYEGEKESNLEVFIEKLDDHKPRDPNTPPFFLSTENIVIANSNFKLTDDNLERSETLNFKDLRIDAENLLVLGPEVTSKIERLSLKSKEGLEVDQLATDFSYTKQQMRFDSLQIKTPASLLKGNLIFNYDRKDFADFVNKVNVVADFKDSSVSFDEINLLYNQFGKGKEVVFSASINGVLNDLNAERLFVQSENTGIRGDFNFKDLFNKEKSFEMNAKIKNLTTSYYQLRSLLPNILGNTLPSSFQKLGQFTIRGDTRVNETSITAKVNLNTAIGSSYSDLTLSNINNIDNASYKGFVSFIDFNIGDFLDNAALGTTSLDFNVEGKGFVKESLNTEVIGEVYSLTYNNYEYKNLKVSGIIKEQLFDGSLISNDENFKFDFKGLADFGKGQNNNFNFIASVDYADLNKLNFTNDSVAIFKGNVNMDITGNSLDNIVGDIKFTKTNYKNNQDTYYFDDFAITSSFSPDATRTVEINSPDIITGYMKGKFKVKELSKLVQNSIGSIYTNYKPFEISKGQKLTFNFKIYNKIIGVIYPEISFGPNTFIRGNIKADEGDFKLNFKSPGIVAYGNKLDKIDIKIDNKNPLFNTFVAVDEVATPYYDMQDFNLINTTLKDTLFFRTEFKGGSDYNDSYNLNFYHTFNKENKSVIGLKTSDVNFKGNTWVLNKDGDSKNKVIINRTLDSITIQEVVMNNSKKEQIRLRGQLADSTFKDLELEFKIVSLNKITPAIDSLKLQGEVNGNLHILQKDNVYLPTCSLDIQDFGINNIDLGRLTVGIFGNRDLTDFRVNSQITDDGVEKLSIIGNITNKNKKTDLDVLANFTDFALEPFSPLGEGVISDIRGKVNGNARIQGDLNSPDFNGLLYLTDAGIGIPYLNVNYDFAANSRVRLEEQTFDFENIQLTDVAEQTGAVLDGTIKHKDFGNWRLDLDVDTQQDRFLILNTEFDEDELYYGTGFLKGTGRIFGPTTALTIKVDGETAKGTSLNIPISDVATTGDYSFITFREKNSATVLEADRVLKDVQGLEMFMDLEITPDAEVAIVIDQNTGSKLKGTGAGLLLIEIDTRSKFNMFGEFAVVTGEYNFKYGGVIDKTFDVTPGGTIFWDGSPLAAQLNMEAVYKLSANPAPLLDNAGYTRSIPVEVVIRLTDELEKPTIIPDIRFPGTSSIVQSELEYRLQDPQVEERNAFFLLAQGSFVNDQSGLNQQAITGNLIQTGTSLLNSVLGGKSDDFDWGVTYEQSYVDPTAASTGEDRIGVNVSTKLGDRVLINGKFGVPVGGVSETVVAGDVEVQVLLNEEGTLRAKIFNRENEIQQFLADRQGYTQGVGLSYEVEFDSFKELMRKVFEKKEKNPKDKKPIKEEFQSDSYLGKDSLIRVSPKKKPLIKGAN